MRIRHALAAGLLAAAAAGCGEAEPKTAAVKGRLVQGGAPFKVSLPGGHPLPPGDPGVRIKFTRTGDPAANGQAFVATFRPDDATFDVPGPKGAGIPPGSYLVVVYSGAAGDKDDAKAGKPAGPPGGGKGAWMPPGMKGGPPGAGMPSMDGKEVARKDVTVPDGGVLELVLEVDAPKK